MKTRWHRRRFRVALEWHERNWGSYWIYGLDWDDAARRAIKGLGLVGRIRTQSVPGTVRTTDPKGNKERYYHKGKLNDWWGMENAGYFRIIGTCTEAQLAAAWRQALAAAIRKEAK